MKLEYDGGVGCSAWLGIACLLLWLIVSTQLSFKNQYALLKSGSLPLCFSVVVSSVLSFCHFRYRFLLLNLEYAFLQFLRCKYWFIHGVDVMSLPMPNDQAQRPGPNDAASQPKNDAPGSLERDVRGDK